MIFSFKFLHIVFDLYVIWSQSDIDEGAITVSYAGTTFEAYAKRLGEHDRDSAARTTIIDDQSDCYAIGRNIGFQPRSVFCLPVTHQASQKRKQIICILFS